MVKTIIYSKKAFTDIDRIIEFNNLRNSSTTYSQKFVSRLNKRLLQLTKHPLSGMRTDLEGRFLLVWDNYYIFYRLNESSIEISSIYHQKENILR